MKPGDLVEVNWMDSSGDRISSLKLLRVIDLPVRSWGVFVGNFGEKEDHVVLLIEIYFRKFGTLGFEITSVVKSSIREVKVLREKVFDVSKMLSQLETKITESLLMGKVRFCLKGTKCK
jgi:hypothetical protein